MSFFNKIINTIKSVTKTGESVGVQVYRKSKKPLRQYMAPERAEKVLDEQQNVPRRAPMNLPKVDIPKEQVVASKAAVKEMLKRSDQLLKHLEQVKVVSKPGIEDVMHKASLDPEQLVKKPVERNVKQGGAPPTATPRGLLTLTGLIDVLHNHDLQPSDWSASEIAEQFKLREAEVENLLNYYGLVNPQKKTMKKTSSELNV